MWMNTKQIPTATLREFETAFSFRINDRLRSFLLEHNGGATYSGSFFVNIEGTNKTKERCMDCLLDFSDRRSPDGAWEVNRRLRSKIGAKRIIIGRDKSNNLICLERDYKEQYIVVWSHITRSFDRCLLDLPAFIRAIS